MYIPQVYPCGMPQRVCQDGISPSPESRASLQEPSDERHYCRRHDEASGRRCGWALALQENHGREGSPLTMSFSDFNRFLADYTKLAQESRLELD
jgi:hypothetical protein